jgi:allophanate hydrolase subunit 2
LPSVLGSRSTDTLARVGPPALATGDLLPLHRTTYSAAVGLPETPPDDLPRPDELVVLDVVLGPRTDWFTPAAVERLCAQEWWVTPQSNRVGIRLSGEVPLERQVHNELPSEGTALGAIQVPASGQPVMFMADHPLTGGYPVIACVATHHLDLAGQIPVNARVRFRAVATAFPALKTPVGT